MPNSNSQERWDRSVAVLGGGLQGTCTALELARRGFQVTLLERDRCLMNRASLRNEGKIHLGLVYANDRTMATAKLMLQGALHFHHLLAQWIGPVAAARLSYSTPFCYLVAKDSLLQPAELADYYSAVEDEYRSILAEFPHLNYLGNCPDRLYRPLTETELAAHFQPSQLQGGFQTAELAIDTEQLATVIRQAIARSPNIQLLASRQVKSVERRQDAFSIEGIGPEGTWQLEAAQVVNATWESRQAIDRSIGLEPAAGWLHRLKYRIIARLPETLRGKPSATMVIGRYGDVVIRPNQTAYLSWYPALLQGWSHELQPPASWDAPCQGQVEPERALGLASEVLTALDRWFPGIGAATPSLVDAGAIFAHGRTDVDDAASNLHDRTKIGVTSVEGYHSVSTGKLTTAPLFAVAAADRVSDWVGRAQQPLVTSIAVDRR